jgi:hypothetical protein
MAVLPKIVYNFNENNTSTINDYSENGNSGTGANLTIASSSRVGNDASFTTTTGQIDLGNITDLNGANDMSLHLGLKFTGTSGSKSILFKDSQITIVTGFNLDGSSSFTVSLFVNTGVASVTSSTLTNNVFYDVDIVYDNDVLTLYVDGVVDDTDNTESGVIDSNANSMYIGDNSTSNSALFSVNEFKLYDEAITTTIIDAVIAEQNGLNVDVGTVHNFALGDIIGTDFDGSPKYATVSFVGTGDDYRFLPLTDNISSGMVFQRVGNLFDTTRQWALKIDNTPQICFYDGVSLSSEAFTEAKKTYCLTKEGIIENGATKTESYTLKDTDSVIYANGNVTITFPATPNDNKRYEVINIGTGTVTLAGNGKNINGETEQYLTSKYDAAKTIYTGTEHIFD